MIPVYPMIPNLMKLADFHNEPPTIYSLLMDYVHEHYEEPVKTSDLADKGRGLIFDFDYPLAVETKEKFETMILNHFLMRRIGYETLTSFKIALCVKLNEVMPMYNKLFTSLDGWQLFRDGEVITRVRTDDRNSVSNTSTTTSNSSDRRYSDTPQNQIQDVKDGKYVSEYNYDQDSGSASGNSNITDKNNTDEVITKSPSDKMKIYTEFLKNRQNVYTMIFKDLDELFYQLT